MQFVEWRGTDGWVPQETLGTSPQLTVELSGLPYTRTIQAIFDNAPLPAFDLRASLDFLLAELDGGPNPFRWYDADFNGSDLGSYSSNGIPDGGRSPAGAGAVG